MDDDDEVKNKRKAKQFTKAGQMEMTLKQRRLHIILYQDTLKVERKKCSRYQELLDEQVTANAKLQKERRSR